MVLRHGGVDETVNYIERQLDRIERKLDKLLELLEQPWMKEKINYPQAPHEQVIDIYRYPWRQHVTSSSP